MDQTAPSHQGFLRQHRERRQDPDMGRLATYVSIAIMKKRLNLKHSLYEILRVLDLNMFEMTSIETLLGRPVEPTELSDYPIQQDLFQTLGH